jgi:hypothetical protein
MIKEAYLLYSPSTLISSIHPRYLYFSVYDIKICCREILQLRLELQREAELAGMKVSLEAEEERRNEQQSLMRIQVKGKAATREIIDVIATVCLQVSQGMQHMFFTVKGRLQFMFVLVVAALLAFGIVAAREMTVLGFAILQRLLMTPSIVREYGHTADWIGRLTSIFFAPPKPPTCASSSRNHTPKIVLNPPLQHRLNGIMNATHQATTRRKGSGPAPPLRNVLLYGPCGTGKSMVASFLAREQEALRDAGKQRHQQTSKNKNKTGRRTTTTTKKKIPYAIMSGADMAPLGSQGALQLKQLLRWANRQPHGAIVVIDEAECALGSRIRNQRDSSRDADTFGAGSTNHNRSSSSYARDALNVLLSLTGDNDTNGKCMLILVTSQPHDLDEAVLSRMDDLVYMSPPGDEERLTILENSFRRHFQPQRKPRLSFTQKCYHFVVGRFSRALGKSHISSSSSSSPRRLTYDPLTFDPNTLIAKLVKETSNHDGDADADGCCWSGRELDKLMQGIVSAVYSTDKGVLDTPLWHEVTKAMKTSLQNKRKAGGSLITNSKIKTKSTHYTRTRTQVTKNNKPRGSHTKACSPPNSWHEGQH